VPAAAVIPAPIAYIKVVAVKKLVVGSVSSRRRTTERGRLATRAPPGDRSRRVSGTSCRQADTRLGRRPRRSARTYAEPRFRARPALRPVERGARPVGLGNAAAVKILSASAGRVSRSREPARSARAGRHVYFEQIRVLKAGSIVAGGGASRVVARRTALNMVAWNNGTGPRSRPLRSPSARSRPRGASVRGSPAGAPRSRPRRRLPPSAAYVRLRRGLRNVVSANPGRWSVFGTGGNDRQRQAWAFVPRR